MTGSGDVALIPDGGLCEGIVDMNALQTVFLFQVEVTVNGDLTVKVFSQQGEDFTVVLGQLL